MLEQFDKQRNRGVQGFGIFDGQEGNMVRSAKEDKILKWLVKYDSNLLLMHHRFPTSTVNVKRAAHPFSTKDYFGKTQYILVHNGSIRNAEELFVAHQEKGIEYYSMLQDLTFNDSEALLWDFALYKEGKQKELKAYGGMAFICLKLVKGKLTNMYFGRNNNPLKLNRTKTGISLSSEGEGEEIKRDVLYNWNYKVSRLTQRKLEIPSFNPNYVRPNYQSPAKSGTYTPGSYASGQSYCNCDDVGWARCYSHGYGADDYESSYGQANWWDKDDDWDYQPTTSRLDGGEQLGNVLSRQFPNLFKKNRIIPRRSVQYEADPDSQLLLPVGTKDAEDEAARLAEGLTHDQQRKIAEEELVKKKNTITEDEIAREYLGYLAGAKGSFEQANWIIEIDYEKAQNLPDTLNNIRERLVLEKVLERLQNDPENESEDSVSSVWRAVCPTK